MNDNPFDFHFPNLDCGATPEQYAEANNLMLKIAYYLRLTGHAKQFRLDGQIDRAFKLEERAEQIYKSLPAWAKW